jgi:hypothetical protein
LYSKSYFFFLCVWTTIVCKAQEIYKSDFDAESVISNLYRQQNVADIAYQDFYESMFQYYQNPLNLNNATSEELRGLYMLNDIQIADIQLHRVRFGNFIAFEELQSVESLSIDILKQLSHFLVVRLDNFQKLNTDIRNPDQHYLLFRHSRDVEKSKGYLPKQDNTTNYIGDPNNLYVRYRIQKYNSFSLGFTAEKDAGESIEFAIDKKKYGADFTSFHAIIYQKGLVKKWAIGDYQMQFGQGLVLSGGFFIGKGAETILSVRRNSTGIRPYTSLLETNYLRGSAVTLGFKNLSLTPFVSRKRMNASINSSDSTHLQDDFASLRYTGLHRTRSEMAARHSVVETAFGLNANYLSTNNKLQVGLNSLHIQYDIWIQPTTRFYNINDFRGKRNSNNGFYYSYFWKNVSLFGEAAISENGGKGFVQGLLVSMGQKVDVSMLYRNFSPNLHTPYGNAFSENFRNANEQGIYWGLKLRLSTKTELTSYVDSYRFPWLKYRVSSPSVGHEYMINLRHKFNKKTILSLQTRYESKEKDTYSADEQDIVFLSFHKRNYAMVQIESKVDAFFYFKSRIQGTTYSLSNQSTTGFMLVQDVGINGRKVDLSCRSSIFETDDFENRQYVYEADVLYSFNFPFYSGKGMRNYVVTKFNLNRQLTLWLKYGRTTYFDREMIGSGNEQISGNIRSEVRWQIRYNFL